MGDRVLREIAGRWTRVIREDDILVRYGGDEFIALVDGAATLAEASSVMRRLEQAAAAPIDLGRLQLRLSVTIGVAFANDSAANLEELVAAADRDMYSRKRAVRP